MALRPFKPVPQVPLAEGWKIIAPEGNRTVSGLKATMQLTNGTVQAMHTFALGNAAAQAKTIGEFADVSGLDTQTLRAKVLELAEAIEGALRLLEIQEPHKEARPQAGTALTFADMAPWPEAVDGAALLTDLAETFATYLVLPKGAKEALALWTLHSYLFDATHISPILGLLSPQKRCGKTTLLSVLRVLVHRPLPASNISPAAVFRTIEQSAPTLLVDELDTFIGKNEELRGVLNSGHTRTLAFVIRTVGEEHEPRQFSTWCPKVVALIGKLPDTMQDRTIVIPMQRRKRDEPVKRWREDRVDTLQDLPRKCLRWAHDHLSALRARDPDVPETLHDRAADNWRPLLAIADEMGEACGKTAREALAAIEDIRQVEEDSAGINLLADMQKLFVGQQIDCILSRDLAPALARLDERPWQTWHKDKPITPQDIATLLAPFGIKSKELRNDKQQKGMGYQLSALEGIFARYLGSQGSTGRQSSKDATKRENQGSTNDTVVDPQKSQNPAPNKACRPVDPQKGGTGAQNVFSAAADDDYGVVIE